MFHGLIAYINGLNGFNCMGFHVGLIWFHTWKLWAKNLYLHLSTALKRAQKKPSKLPWFPSSKPSHLRPETFFIMGNFHPWKNVQEIFTKKTFQLGKRQTFYLLNKHLHFKPRKKSMSTKQPTNQLLVDPTVDGRTWLELISTIGFINQPISWKDPMIGFINYWLKNWSYENGCISIKTGSLDLMIDDQIC